MKTRKLSTIAVGVKADGKTDIELQGIQDVEETNSCLQDETENSLANKYRELEKSQLIGKFVMDYDPMHHRVSSIFQK